MRSQWIFYNFSSRHPSWASPLVPLSSRTFAVSHSSISLLLSICGREGCSRLGSSIHASIIKTREFYGSEDHVILQNSQFVWNSLLSMYAKCGDSQSAFKLFGEMPLIDTVSWNTLISGCISDGELAKGVGLLRRMCEMGINWVDKATLTTVLSGCDRQELCHVTELIHGMVLKGGFYREIPVGNALITSYFNCESSDSGRRVFDEMCDRNVITWTAVITGLVQYELYKDALKLFVEMRSEAAEPNLFTYLSFITACSGLRDVKEGSQIHGLIWKLGFQSDLCIESALMDMYSKCGKLDDAWDIFESAETVDEVSMTVILVGFARNGLEEEAVQMFVKVLRAGFEVDSNVISAILGVFGADTSLGLGKQIHSLVIKRRLGLEPFVGNGLINMYSKCGDLMDSVKFFNRMPRRNLVSWNSMIAAFARHGDGLMALKFYEQMISQCVKPTDVTFLSLLHACSHVGLVGKGMEFLDSMQRDFGLVPRTEHYACIIDMLGRAGLLSEAKRFIMGLPLKPDVLIWQALLGACSIQGDSEMGKFAFEKLLSAAPENSAPYVLMANIFSSEGKWRDRARTIQRMKEVGIAKETGISWIEIEKEVHSFVVDDRMHPQSQDILRVLRELFVFMADEGYVPDKRFILYYLEDREIVDNVHHSL
ncbi:hypothetical protein SAY87_015420 [Trapa incisa]|uniref:Pentatricopeptide repeat-containing protein n=1 Tax=Trapa incisa TaxID=236973 RepID=A0AAN7GU78_9MYRT|nr:hypothetical protein SAY87_015420 [Trapa incisa]